jgi:cyclic beta-1,2-glucan synthetase
MLAAVLLAPVLLRLLFQLARDSRSLSPASFGVLGGDLRTNAIQAWLGLVVALDQAFVALDAILRTLYRLAWSKRRLLEWRTMRQSARLLASSSVGVVARRTWFSAALAAALLIVLWVYNRETLPFAAPVLACWLSAPLVVAWLSRDTARERPAESLTEDDRRLLRGLACKTWRYFETFVTERDNFLPPDNYQQEPRGVVAHRTSPTNIGLYLLSVTSARDLGYLTLREALTRLEQTFQTLDRMDKRNGHILNWYDTESLRPLDPQYVSTVDSGNLAAALWTLRQACDEFCEARLVGPEVARAARDLLALFESELERGSRHDERFDRERRRLERALSLAESRLAGPLSESVVVLRELSATAAEFARSARELKVPEAAELELGRLEALLANALSSLREVAPLLELLDELPRELAELPSLGALTEPLLGVTSLASLRERSDPIRAALALAFEECAALEVERRARYERCLGEFGARLEQAESACYELEQALRELGRRAAALADGMDFRFLFDESRELFVTGYNVTGARLDTSHYDLLASEARVASLVAIAKGDVPQEHWFRLGRPRTAVGSRRCLLSWSGSMFEFLMPLLVTRNHPGTLLHETCE